jgi:protein-L-isoaspartate(D-aspartate) O-methyltransferase
MKNGSGTKPFHIHRLLFVLIICLCLGFSRSQAGIRSTTEEIAFNEDDLRDQRLAMVERARNYFDLKNIDVLNAMEVIPRHLFVPEDVRELAYYDNALAIGYGQTISAPYMAAWMTEELELKAGESVLEIGTGSGYQAAVLAQLGYVEVYSIEIIPDLAERAVEVLEQFDYKNLYLKQGDGYYGWEEFAPYDAIIVTAAPDHLPAPLVQQLADGGRLLIPIGPTGGFQILWKFLKNGGQIKAYNLGSVVFVPLVSEGEPQPMQIPTEK